MNLSLEDRLKSIQKKHNNLNIENEEINNTKTLEEFIDSKRINLYSRTWNKLEHKLKINKIVEFIDSNDYDITDDNKSKIVKVLTILVKTNKLNKSSDVNYNKDKCKIIDIKYLKFDDDNKCYKWKDQCIKL